MTGGTVTFAQGCVVSDSTTGGAGGAFFVQGGDLLVQDSMFTDSRAEKYGGFLVSTAVSTAICRVERSMIANSHSE
eukprot:4652400-Prymnesium_polylepis.1